MKFTCTKENLSHALQHVSGAAGKNIHLPILNNVCISTEDKMIRFVTTNLEMAIKTNVRGVVEQEGKFTVPAKTLSEYIQLVSGEQVSLTLEENEVIVQTGKSRTKIKGNPADEFPIIPHIDAKTQFSVTTKELRSALGCVLFACSKSEVRPELSGVFFQFNKQLGTLTLAATDSYRLAEVQIPLIDSMDQRMDCIIPHRSLFEVARILTVHEDAAAVQILIDETQVVFVLGDVTVTSRKIEGKYPDYAQIIPTTQKTKAIFLVEALVKEVKAASIFASQGINAVVMDCNVQDGTIGVSSTSTQLGEHASTLAAEVSGEEGGTLLNYRYVLDGFAALGTEEGEMWINGQASPVVFKPKEKSGFLYIVMPIRQ